MVVDAAQAPDAMTYASHQSGHAADRFGHCFGSLVNLLTLQTIPPDVVGQHGFGRRLLRRIGCGLRARAGGKEQSGDERQGSSEEDTHAYVGIK